MMYHLKKSEFVVKILLEIERLQIGKCCQKICILGSVTSDAPSISVPTLQVALKIHRKKQT